MFSRVAVAAFALAACVVTSAWADELGRVRINGSEAILYDDNTWEYAGEEASAPDNCTEIDSAVLPVSVCLDPDKWSLANLNGAEEHSFKLVSDELYILLITEKTVVEMDALKGAIISNAQKAAKLNKVETLEDDSAVVDGHTFGHVVYKTVVDSIRATYENYYTNFPGKGTLQIVAFVTNSDQFENLRPNIAEVIAGVSIKE